MNIIAIPFHDWRKSKKEGFRTRDCHLINALQKDEKVKNILVINRPTTLLELFYKKTPKRIEGEILKEKYGFRLIKVDSKIFVVDFVSKDLVGQVFKKQKWFIEAYNNKNYVEFIKQCLNELRFEDSKLITQNIFAYKLALTIPVKIKLFDAWDNFLKFPAYKKIRINLRKGYEESALGIRYWTTNSKENIIFYRETFNVENISLLKNGVKMDFNETERDIPQDLATIKKPIIGFGGKVSYLLNVDLINYITSENKNLSFVFVGQILNKDTYAAINKLPNVYFLGDKHYNDYPNYVNNFDICIIPYNIGKGQHGGDSIKAYEYLSTGKKVVGTNGNGLEDLADYIYIVDTPKEFSDALKDSVNDRPQINISDYSWSSKASTLIKILNEGYY